MESQEKCETVCPGSKREGKAQEELPATGPVVATRQHEGPKSQSADTLAAPVDQAIIVVVGLKANTA